MFSIEPNNKGTALQGADFSAPFFTLMLNLVGFFALPWAFCAQRCDSFFPPSFLLQ